MDTTSPTLLDGVRHKQANAWDCFDRIYRPLLTAYARKFGLQDADAQDVVQDVMAKLRDALGGYHRQPGRKFRSWLSAVVRNQCVSLLRGRKADGEDGLSGVEAREHPNVDDLDEAEHRLALVRGMLPVIRQDFDEKTWTAFHRLVIENRPAADVAGELGITPNAAYLGRHRVMTRLKEELAGLLD